MSVRQFTLAVWGFIISLALLILWGAYLSPWLVSRGQQPGWLIPLLGTAICVLSLTFLGVSLQRAIAVPRMTAFRVRYHLEAADTTPAGFAEFLTNLSAEARYAVLTLMVYKGKLRMYLEVPGSQPPPEGFAPAVREYLPHPDVLPAGECVQTPHPLVVRPLKVYMVWQSRPATTAARAAGGWRERLVGMVPLLSKVLPPAPAVAAAPRPVETETDHTDLGRKLLDLLLQWGGDGELRWHLFPRGQGLITLACEQTEVLKHVKDVPAACRRMPRLVVALPKTAPPVLQRVTEAVRNLYWWWPLCDNWGGPLAQRLWLSPTPAHPDLDSAGVRLPVPPDYAQEPPVLVLGQDTGKQAPVGISLARGLPGHLLIAGGGAAQERLGLVIVEQALRRGMAVVALGNQFDGLGVLYNSLPRAIQEQVLHFSPQQASSVHVGLMSPAGAMSSASPDVVEWVGKFLAAEGITNTTHEEALLLCLALCLQGLQRSADFDLFEMTTVLRHPEDVRALLGEPSSADCPAEISEFISRAADGFENWRASSYEALVAQRLPMLTRNTGTLKTTRPPYINLVGLLENGGGLFCSLPLVEGGRESPITAQLARYLLYSTLHALAVRQDKTRPVLLYLGDFPFYLAHVPTLLAGLHEQGCMVVLSAANVPVPQLEQLALWPPDTLFPLVLRTAEDTIARLAGMLTVPSEALRRLQGRTAILRHPYRGQMLVGSVNVLESCPPISAPSARGEEESVPAAPAAPPAAIPVEEAVEEEPAAVVLEETGEGPAAEEEEEGWTTLPEEPEEAGVGEGDMGAWAFHLIDPAEGDEAGEEEEDAAGALTLDDLGIVLTEEMTDGVSLADSIVRPVAVGPGGLARNEQGDILLPPVGKILDHRGLGLPDLPEETT